MEVVAGLELDPIEPGYKKILFKPRPGGTISHAAASLKTTRGKVAISWKIKGVKLHLQLTVPKGSTAILSLPDKWKTGGTKFGPGTHRLIAE